MYEVNGSCYCKNILVEIGFTQPLMSYKLRECDCTFCRKHTAAYISDSDGTLIIKVKDERLLGRYHQDGYRLADFLHCLNCGVLIGVLYQEEGKKFGVINSSIIDGGLFMALYCISLYGFYGEEESKGRIPPQFLKDFLSK